MNRFLPETADRSTSAPADTSVDTLGRPERPAWFSDCRPVNGRPVLPASGRRPSEVTPDRGAPPSNAHPYTASRGPRVNRQSAVRGPGPQSSRATVPTAHQTRPTADTVHTTLGSGAVNTDHLSPSSGGDAAAVLDQETRRAGELVGLFRDHRHRQFLPGQIRAGQFHAFGGVALVQVDVRGLRVLPGRGERATQRRRPRPRRCCGGARRNRLLLP